MYSGEEHEVYVELGCLGKVISGAKTSLPEKSKAGGKPVGSTCASVPLIIPRDCHNLSSICSAVCVDNRLNGTCLCSCGCRVVKIAPIFQGCDI